MSCGPCSSVATVIRPRAGLLLLPRSGSHPAPHRHDRCSSEPSVSAANGIDYAYRQVGEGTPALVLLQHFRGNLDNWDPALVDALAHNRRVVTFDNAGVAGSTGTTPSTITQMARDAIAFLEALKLDAVDLLGFSIGSFVAREIALIRPAVARGVVLGLGRPARRGRHPTAGLPR